MMNKALSSLLLFAKENGFIVQSKLVTFFTLYISILFAGFFFMPTDLHRDIFYVGGGIGIFAFIKAVLQKKNIIDLIKSFDPIMLFLGLTFLGYSTLTILWSDYDDVSRAIKFAKTLPFLTVFAAIYIYTQRNEQLSKAVITSFLFAAFIGSLLAVLLHFLGGADVGIRLNGLGRAENPVALGILCAIAMLLLTFTHDYAGFLKKTVVKAIVLAVLLTALALTYSRGAQLSFIAAFFLLLIVNRNYKIAGVMALLAITAASIFAVSYVSGAIPPIDIIERGTTGRFGAWLQGVELIKQSPIWGHGVASKFHYDVTYLDQTNTFSHIHNLYLAHLIQGGLIGSVLFSAAYLYCFFQAFSSFRTGNDQFLLVFLFVGALLGLTDFGGFHTSLGISWLVFWVPLIHLTGQDRRKRSSH